MVNCQRFQSTFPRGERHQKGNIAISADNFNPRSRVGNDVICVRIRNLICRFQSTFPRGERHLFLLRTRICLKFQSTFPRGERQLLPRSFPRISHFNPRSRVGNDGVSKCTDASGKRFQSTFPRGERLSIRQSSLLQPVFQSTFPRGERLSATSCLCFYFAFQSTFPRGERRSS